MQNSDTILGIIAEYNPFHSGHLYQIKRAKELSKAKYVLVIMSGHFVQRGEPAIYDPYSRTKMALNNMVDIVLEIPAPFSTASATDFAGYSVNLLHKLGVDYISFGAESANMDDLNLISNIVRQNTNTYSSTLSNAIAKGDTYPLARKKAILDEMLFNSYSEEKIKHIEDILIQSNNILGIEYVYHLNRLNSSIKPVIIKREGSNYNDISLNEKSFSSASAIRNSILAKNTYNDILPFIPEKNINFLSDLHPINPDFYCGDIHRKILSILHSGDNLSDYYDLTEDMANRLSKNIAYYSSFEKIIDSIKTKNYTYTRISRALMHIMLNIRKDKISNYKSNDYSVYARLIGFKKDSVNILKILKERSSIPIISKLADSKDILGKNSLEYSLLSDEVFSGLIYNSIYKERYNKALPNPFERHIIIT